MLIIPVADSPGKRFPYITLLLILLNCAVFFIFQQHEQERRMKALSWARSSGLLEIESLMYWEFLERRQEEIPDILRNTDHSTALFQYLAQDDRFQSALRERILIPPADPRFTEWFSKRQIFEEKLNQTFSYQFGYSPARKNYLGILTYMFLHQGVIQLIGNMVFLWFIGAWMEIGVGRCSYIGMYLFTGMLVCLVFGFMYPFNQVPLLGSSGAVAGLAGAYLLIYRRSGINVFCSLGFCGGYTSLFGWFLFPFWFTKELYFFFNNIGSQEIYAVSGGGLLAGILFALIFRTRAVPEQGTMDTIIQEHTGGKKVAWSVRRGLKKQTDKSVLSDAEAEAAREKIVEVLKRDSNDLTALAQLFHIDKRRPKSEQFHQTADKLLEHLADLDYSPDIQIYFEEYKRISDSPRLQLPVMLALAEANICSWETSRATRFLVLLLKKRPEYPGLPSCIFRLGCAYREQEKDVRAKKCFQFICTKYPQTIISQKAEEQLATPVISMRGCPTR